jgi:hypothetical protein
MYNTKRRLVQRDAVQLVTSRDGLGGCIALADFQ